MQNNRIFIGNLSYDTTVETLIEAFSQYGEIIDSFKPDRKGFAFITYQSDEQAQAAIEAMNGKELDGRPLVVNVARPKEDRPRRTFGRGGGDRRGGGFNRNRDHRDRRDSY